jgi:ParB family chromosome partitioning protein
VPKTEQRVAAELHPLAQREARDDKAVLIPIEQLQPDPEQPRRAFEQKSLEELASSIKQHGVLQALIVLEEDGHYKIIAGERRYRAAQLAGLTDLPARIHQEPSTVREIQLVENLQREDLGLLEEAHALAELRLHANTSIRGLEEVTGKSKSYIARRLKILDMPKDVQAMLEREPRLLSKADKIAKIADPKRRASRIKALLHEDDASGPVQARQQGRPVHPLSLRKKKDGGFDLVVKYRPGQTDGIELVTRLRQVIAELEGTFKNSEK